MEVTRETKITIVLTGEEARLLENVLTLMHDANDLPVGGILYEIYLKL